jgi:hypothetical protein
VYWFIFQKFLKVYKGNEIPKYTREDADKFGKEISHYNIQPKGEIIFGDIWGNRMSYTLVALEEAEYKKWTWGRIACLGDSIHKMTPNAGHGGNGAIESAAAFANSIKAMLDKTPGGHPTYEQVTSCLAGYQKVREKRMSEIMKAANKLTRIQALKTFGDYLFAHWIGPALGDALLEMHSGLVSPALLRSAYHFSVPQHQTVDNIMLDDWRREDRLPTAAPKIRIRHHAFQSRARCRQGGKQTVQGVHRAAFPCAQHNRHAMHGCEPSRRPIDGGYDERRNQLGYRHSAHNPQLLRRQIPR